MKSRKPNRINVMDGTQTLLNVLALADKEIEAGETVPIEEVIKEFDIRAPKKLENNPK
ncbi:MAG TPA: hypothetical protein VGE85_00185 [Terracidiphilus sp.]